MAILVTGAAGFIGFHVARTLLARGARVIGVDNLNSYYDVALKEARLAALAHPQFSFQKLDIADREGMTAFAKAHPDITRVIHMAAQAGVRHSLEDPYAYVQANVLGQVTILETLRLFKSLETFVYASSSSVYGRNTKVPFSEDDPVNQPASLYAATKRSCELIAETYAHLYGIPATGLRFFTVYGPWGRPDMAAYSFTRDILAGRPIKLFNAGAMERDFTYIDDIVAGVLAAAERRPGHTPPHMLYNLGNNRPEKLADFVAAIEAAAGRKAIVENAPMQPGDVVRTYADITRSARDLGFEPKTPMREGIAKFVAWYRQHYCV